MKIEIDLSNEVINDLSLDQLQKLQLMVKTSIPIARKKAKKKDVQIDMFGSIETISEIKTTFEKSNVSNWSVFEKELLDLEQMGVDINFYFNAVKDWSLTKPNEKRTSRGWIATARSFMRSDTQKNKLKMITDIPKESVISNDDFLNYLNM